MCYVQKLESTAHIKFQFFFFFEVDILHTEHSGGLYDIYSVKKTSMVVVSKLWFKGISHVLILSRYPWRFAGGCKQ